MQGAGIVMKIVRYSAKSGGEAQYGILRDSTVYSAEGDLFGGLTEGSKVGSLDDVTLHAPIEPGKVIAIGLNYVDHVTELDKSRELPMTPVMFMKPPSAIIGPGQAIQLAYPENETHYEAELVVVIGKTAKDVAEEDALNYVLGYTAGNDVSDRVQQYGDGQWVRGKGYDTYLPLGPAIETDLDISDIQVQSRLNGEKRQSESTKSLIFGVPFLISFISDVMTLNPGDIIMTGTPHGVGPMKDGDVIEIDVEGIGVLSNPVKNRVRA
jgi:2-keto-4-pentenoate hydratase/2-oxohepta-3-ene-1,7-dioic acid hydratase in catechol pathway